MRDLATFQREFGRALLGGENLPDLQLALIIHRNTSLKGLVAALTANFPTVAQLVGEEWFKGCALEYIRVHPARSPVLATYGESFASFLDAFPPASDLPYLAEVARIDRLWVEAHTSRDAPVLSPVALSNLPQSALGKLSLALHPAARITWVRHSAATIWIHHRSSDAGAELEVDGSEEGILLTRSDGQVAGQLLDRPAFELLKNLSHGATLSAAAEAALTYDASTDVAGLLARTLVAGAFERPAEMLS